MAFLNPQQLTLLGLASVGENVLISDRASIYGADAIEIANNVRIDDFCILSAGESGISIGSYIHIGAYSSLIGAGRIRIDDFANISSRVAIYSSSDDYSGISMSNPMVSPEFKNVDVRPVHIGRHAIIGCGSVVLPGVEIGVGAAIGALSLVRENCESFRVYAGIPARDRGARARELLELERKILQEQGAR